MKNLTEINAINKYLFFFVIKIKLSKFFFFFFQAEDGIRDLYVTGVQTCALPISWATRPTWPSRKLSPLRAKASTWGAGMVFEREMPCRSVCSKRTNSTPSAAILDRTSSRSISALRNEDADRRGICPTARHIT